MILRGIDSLERIAANPSLFSIHEFHFSFYVTILCCQGDMTSLRCVKPMSFAVGVLAILALSAVFQIIRLPIALATKPLWITPTIIKCPSVVGHNGAGSFTLYAANGDVLVINDLACASAEGTEPISLNLTSGTLVKPSKLHIELRILNATTNANIASEKFDARLNRAEVDVSVGDDGQTGDEISARILKPTIQ